MEMWPCNFFYLCLSYSIYNIVSFEVYCDPQIFQQEEELLKDLLIIRMKRRVYETIACHLIVIFLKLPHMKK